MEYYETQIEGFRIRKAERTDIPVVLELIKELAEYEKMSDDVVATPKLLEEWIFDKEKAQVLLGEADGEIVGMALYFYNFSTFLGRAGIYLEDLFVKPSMRGSGMGKALLTQLARIAVEEGCGRMEWSCLNWNAPSIGFYKSLGAVPMDEWTVYRLTGDVLDELGR
ncbi:GNAT family N-acetyltransferase [Diplocloster agilis]|uniref:GNAT family N-acetyltransferase n=1 Tax=Diplocloster agilis TaxID=2850323 RepID=A0A949NG37_9FIRM|nr:MULTISPECIES: GNAT family N-acetyltransferase [Lachnospiraceae]MBU9735948.1 GNAT family N-acetyltransferase [Diplocloster agilis]MBU9745409.1 GNAT family N-acetyltransferase [Diplocloster agilis]MCU6732861.1 GNAT family N-acetyltransferase [Suonthocola fibrivorans]SCI65401.1 putative acetyltransferase [uncultured Clostridium sp.]